MEQVDRKLSFMLSLPVLALITAVGSSIFVFPIMSRFEGEWFPVVKNVEVWQIDDSEPNSIRVMASFDKVRSCELMSLNWYNTLNQRVPVIFRLQGQEEEIAPVTLDEGEDRTSGPWDIIGISTLDGARAVAVHRCNPFYLTYTQFYP